MNSSSSMVEIHTPRFTIEGLSRAGNETWFRLRELGFAFDIGRCPDRLVGLRRIFVSHAHLDHALGVPFYFAQRNLQGLPCGTIYVPAASAEAFEALMAVHERLEGFRYEYRIEGVEPGQLVDVRRGLKVRAHAASHRIPSNAWEVVEVRQKLRDEFAGLAGHEIAALRQNSDIRVTESREESILFYTGDTDRGILETSAEVFRSKVLMIECSFTAEDDRERARKYRHIHLDDLFDYSDRFENELIVLTHFSLRDDPREIHQRVRSRCPSSLRSRIRLALPAPFDAIAS